MNFADNLTEMISMAFPDSDIANKFSFSPDKASYIVNFGLGPYYENQINNILLKSEFLSAQFDESLNKISQKGQMDLHVRYMDSDSIVQTRYVTSAFLGKATAAHFLDALKSCFR